MSSKKKPAQKAPTKPAPKQANSSLLWIGLMLIAVLVGGIAWANNAKSKNAVSGADAGSSGSATGAAADEAKYIGRLLPAGYQEAAVKPVSYSGVTDMTDVKATSDPAGLSISAADLQTDKIVYFEYKRADGAIPMIAYVKPSGQIFVGVSYCLPCKSTKQYVDADGTLTCKSCGTKRDLTSGVGISGSCKLYPLDEVPAKITGGKLVIDKGTLDKWTPQPMDRKVG